MLQVVVIMVTGKRASVDLKPGSNLNLCDSCVGSRATTTNSNYVWISVPNHDGQLFCMRACWC